MGSLKWMAPCASQLLRRLRLRPAEPRHARPAGITYFNQKKKAEEEKKGRREKEEGIFPDQQQRETLGNKPLNLRKEGVC